jgi:hypothetical protein
VIVGGPELLRFEPAKGEKRYLMFLVRESNGRFAPVNGQQDSKDISVQEMLGVTVDD